ncbi:MAG: hypothetical protein Tsb0014_35520 [Pleurocapsa sp.]
MINILIVDDQKSVRARLEYLIESIADFKVAGVADNGLDAIARVQNLKPDIVLLDMEMPQLDGLMATRLICAESPKTKILVLSSHDEQEYVIKSMSAGATGYLLKGSSDEEIEQAIRFVAKGYTHMGAGLFEKMLPVVKETTAIEQVPLPSNLQTTTKDIILAPATTIQAQEEINQQHDQNSTQQILAWLIVTLSLTVGIYGMRQWLRKPLPALSYSEQASTITETKFAGKIQPAKTFKIAAINPGVVENIQVKVGEKVEPGQPLLTIKNLAAENEKKQIIQEQQLTRQQQQTVLQQQQTAQQQILDLEQKINRLKYNLAPLRAKIAEANLQVSLARSQAEKLPLRQRQDSVPRTKAVYERAKARFERLNSLNQQGAISQEQLEQAQADLDVAKVDYDMAITAERTGAKLEQSQRELSQLQEQLAIQEQQDAIAQLEKQKQTARLEYQQASDKLALLRQQAQQLNQYQVPEVNKVITATEAGIIAELPVTPGDQIYAGNAVVELAKLEQLKIEVPVHGRLINGLNSQQGVSIQIGEGVTAQKFEGKIATVNPLPTENLNYVVEVEFANPNHSLLIGQLAKVQFIPQNQTMAEGN